MDKFSWRLQGRDESYDILVSWWTAHKAFNSKIIEHSALPSRIFVVSKGETDLFMVPVYASDSTFCWLGWTTSNPEAKLRDKVGALDYLYEIISIVMKSLKYEHIISKANARSLQRVAERSGFENVGQTTYHIKNL